MWWCGKTLLFCVFSVRGPRTKLKSFFREISVRLSHFPPHKCSHYCSLRPVMITVKSAGRTASMQFVKSKYIYSCFFHAVQVSNCLNIYFTQLT